MSKVRLGDIAEVITKGTTPTSLGYEFKESGINFIKIESITESGCFISDKFAHISSECHYALKRSQLKKNDVLFSIAGAIGRVGIVDDSILPANTNQALAIIRIPDGVIDYNYLFYYLHSNTISQQYNRKKQGVAQINLSLNDISNFEIELPSINEQRRIANNLDKAITLILSDKKRLAKLDELVKSRFMEMFGYPVSNSKHWKTEFMNDVAPSNNYDGIIDEDVWLLNLDMIESQTGRIIEYRYVKKKDINNSTCSFDTSNVLYSKLRPYLNKVVIPDRAGYATSELIPLQPDKTKLNRDYFAFMLRSDEFVSLINEKVAGAKMPRVSMTDFKKFSVPIPPIELQNQFADFVTKVEQQKATVQKSIEKLDTLKKSLMQEYFG